MPKANAIDLAKTLRKLKTGNFEFFHILTSGLDDVAIFRVTKAGTGAE